MHAVDDHKETLHRYLRDERDGLLSKLDGLAEYDLRRPLTPTGTNLLGVVKHVASVGLDYFTQPFHRPRGRELPWFAEGAEPDADFYATPEETSAEIVELLVRLNREQGQTFVLVTHDASVAARAHRTVRMRDGLIEGDTPNGGPSGKEV